MQCDKAVELKTAFQQMIELLEREHSAIRTRDTDALSQLTTDKAQLAKNLELIGNTIIRELKLTVNSDNANKLVALIKAHCPQEGLSDTLREASAKVQQLNNRNGILLQSMMRINEQSLNILTGRPSKIDTYQASGQIKNDKTTSSNYLATV